jgi:RNA polymerase sigma-70 factor (ECF subfamily)
VKARNGRTRGNSESAGTSDLVRLHADRVFRFLAGLVRDRDTAADLTQETFLKLHRLVQRGERSDLSVAYVFTVARNTALSYFRRRTVERKHLENAAVEAQAETTEDPHRALERAQLRESVRSAVAELPEELRTVFLLSEIEGLAYAEIGRIVGCPEGTVASRKHHAVRRLRETLRRLGHAL